jgi:hypothetical protein
MGCETNPRRREAFPFADENRGYLDGRRARQTSRRALIPAPKLVVTDSRVRGGDGGQIPETPPGVPTGFGLGSVGGDRCQKRDWTAGIGGGAVQLALTISRATVDRFTPAAPICRALGQHLRRGTGRALKPRPARGERAREYRTAARAESGRGSGGLAGTSTRIRVMG